MFIIIAVFMMS